MPIFGDDFLSTLSPLTSPLATAQYRPTPAAAFPNPPASPSGAPAIPPVQPPTSLSPFATAQYRPTPDATFLNPTASPSGPLPIPPAQPPIFLSPPDPAGALGSIGQGVANGINNHALTLMALGAGIAQGGVGKGLAQAASAAQAERSLQAQQVTSLQTYKALTGAGVPPEEALAGVMNPSLMRALAVKYLGPRAQGNTTSAPAPAANGTALNPRSAPTSAAKSSGLNPQGRATNIMPASAVAPASPPNVTAGASYSPTRSMWRDLGGNRFDLQGKAVA